jgi:tetratricopeptide (TPR) repeat protein
MQSRISASEGDVVQLLADLPQSEFKRDQRGTVVTVFTEPSEAYDLEIVDESGSLLGFAYSVKPNQFSNLSRNAFVAAMEAVESGNLLTAEKQLKLATELRPDNIGAFVNSVLMSFGRDDFHNGQFDVSLLIPLLRMSVRVDPTYENARVNLAIAFLKFGVKTGLSGKHGEAVELFYSALAIKTDLKTEAIIKTNLVIALSSLGRESFRAGRFDEGFALFRTAFLVIQDDDTIRNLGVAYGIYGTFLMESKDFDFAIQHFERAEDAGVISADFINCYGGCLALKGKIDMALAAFERVLEIDPKHEYALQNLHLVHQVKDIGTTVFLNNLMSGNAQTGKFVQRDYESMAWRQSAVLQPELAVLG